MNTHGQQRDISHKVYGKSHIPKILASRAPTLDIGAYRAVAEVFPARTNDYVLNELIDWYAILLCIMTSSPHILFAL